MIKKAWCGDFTCSGGLWRFMRSEGCRVPLLRSVCTPECFWMRREVRSVLPQKHLSSHSVLNAAPGLKKEPGTFHLSPVNDSFKLVMYYNLGCWVMWHLIISLSSLEYFNCPKSFRRMQYGIKIQRIVFKNNLSTYMLIRGLFVRFWICRTF